MLVSRIVVIITEATDKICLYTTLPSAVWPFEGPMVTTFEAAKGTGLEYVKKHFSLEPEVIDVQAEKRT